jgi:hypothetical protein
MHRETIPDSVWRLLLGLSRLGSMQSGYLAGGSGLAIQLGHRVSVDLDFFFPEGHAVPDVLDQLPALGMSATVMSQTPGHCELRINAVKVDLIRERFTLLRPLKVLTLENTTVHVADPVDIGRMKLFSIASRGNRKDFIDLYCLTRAVLPLGDLLALVVEDQRGLRFNPLLFLKGLIDFEEADQDVHPVLLWDISWEKVKEDLTKGVKRLAEEWG